jgi:ribonuclease HII
MLRNDRPLRPDLKIESQLWKAGCRRIAGLDEAGRGALAGPVTVGALILPPDEGLYDRLVGVRDSKEMTPLQRTRWASELKTCALAWGVGFASPAEIDRLGIVLAVYQAARRALQALIAPPEHLLIDYFTLPDTDLPQTSLVKGDAISLSIAGASVLAKTARDAYMTELDSCFPQYGFAQHKGYGTLVHRRAIATHGRCAMHRQSFQLSLLF